jgi:hypothetical protein
MPPPDAPEPVPPCPGFVIVWDTVVVSDEDYADLVVALGDLVWAAGGLGIEPVAARSFSVELGEPQQSA